MDHDLQPLAKQRQRWMTAVSTGDLQGYLGLCTPEVVWLPPTGPAITGRLALRAWLQPFFATYDYTFTVAPTALRVAGEWAIERGSFTSQVMPKAGGDQVEHTGRYLVLWRRASDGRWRIDRYLDETDLAPAE